MPRNNRKPEIVSALAKGGDPIKVADDFGVTRSYVYHLDKKRREGFGAIANNKTSADVKLPGGSLFKELSVSSLKRHGGDVDEEYLRELRGQQGVQLYKEMGNHPVIAAVLQAIKMTLRRVQWYAVPPKSGREEEVQFLNQCMEDMSHTFADYVDQILSMLQYGYAPFETVYKIRKGDARQPGPRISKSRFDDGKIGWRKFYLIGQDTLAPGNSWMFNDEDGSLKGCNQLPPVGTPFIRNRQWYISIPIEKMVLFRTTAEKNNPEGRSVLRAMYPSWYYAKNLEEVEAISAERVGAGFPVVYLGDDISKSTSADSEINEYMKMVRNIRVDEQMGVVIPHPKMGAGMAREGTGVLFEFTAPPVRSGVQFGPIIERHEKRIAMVGLAQFIHLGMGQYGSQSLADVTTDFFQLAVSAWADSIRDTFNRFAVIPLLRLNGMDTRDPILIDHTNVSSPDLKTVADYINKTVGAKVIEPDDQLENSLRRIAALPDKDPTTTRLVMEEVDGDGGLRMDRSKRTKPANNQRNQNPKPDAPRPAEKPAARKPMRASEDTESDDFVGEQDMDTKQAMEFAERMQGKALDSLTKMAEMNKPQPPASITLAPTIQNYDVKEIAQAIRDIPAPKVTVSPTPVTVDVKPNVVNVAPAPVTFNVAQAPAAR